MFRKHWLIWASYISTPNANYPTHSVNLTVADTSVYTVLGRNYVAKKKNKTKFNWKRLNSKYVAAAS